MTKYNNHKLEPTQANCDKDDSLAARMVNLGDSRPDGFELEAELFVDSSGWGSGEEMALTYGQFVEQVKKGKFYAIIAEGQFQIYVGVFSRSKTKNDKI